MPKNTGGPSYRAQRKRYRWWNKHRCPHVIIYGIYGDEINIVKSRLFCPDCRRFLDGPVSLATRPAPWYGVFPPPLSTKLVDYKC